MKKLILFFCSFLIVLFASGQTATITGPTTVCAGSTITLIANITGGFTGMDTVMWTQKIGSSGAIVTIVQPISYLGNTTITVPRDPNFPSTIIPVLSGNTYTYKFYIKRNGVWVGWLNQPLPSATHIINTVNAAPTIGNVTFYYPCSEGTMTVNVDGLSGPFPVNIKIYDDGTAPGNLITTQSVNTASTSFTIHYWGTNNGDNSNLYIKVENPSTGCETWK